MAVPAPQSQDTDAIVVFVLFAAALCVRYWAAVVRLIVIVLIALAVLGLIAGLHDVHHIA